MDKLDWSGDREGLRGGPRGSRHDELDDFNGQEWLRRQGSSGKSCGTCKDGKDFKRCQGLACKQGPDGKLIWATYRCPECLEEYVWENTVTSDDSEQSDEDAAGS